ncbi:MAG: DUF882 domain-containing protein, partial [Hyphomicrobiales bacterium]|nr:DUF882 domain-containing protein [Hyphomicrobiales bacterium]
MGAWYRGLRIAGAGSIASGLFALSLTAQVPQTRTISLRNIHTNDLVTVEYKRNGRYVPDALEKINWVLRDWRRDEPTKMDPALIDLLWEMHAELGSKEPINIISGYRSRTTNNMLRKTVGGQASESRHILGKAADVQFPDVPLKHMRYAAMVRERGGVGFYPTSATPFVHVDTDRVRAWPRMPRFELALLFPNGRTQHKPADGGDLSAGDVKTARARQPDVAIQLAAFHDLRRRSAERPTLVAAAQPVERDVPVARAAVPQSPKLLAEPKLVDRPVRLTQRPSDDDRRKLTQLVVLAGMPALIAKPALAVRPPAGPQVPKRKGSEAAASEAADGGAQDDVVLRFRFLSPEGMEALKGWSTGFAPAPAWDDDHPEEAAYRAFPIAPFLSTASIDDPELARLVRPDLSRTGELFEVTA